MCSPAKTIAWRLLEPADARGLCQRHRLRVRIPAGWAHSSSSSTLDVCVTVCPLPSGMRSLPELAKRSRAPQTVPAGRAAKPDVREPPRRSGTKMLEISAEQVALVGVNAWLVQPAGVLSCSASNSAKEGSSLGRRTPSELSDSDPLL